MTIKALMQALKQAIIGKKSQTKTKPKLSRKPNQTKNLLNIKFLLFLFSTMLWLIHNKFSINLMGSWGHHRFPDLRYDIWYLFLGYALTMIMWAILRIKVQPINYTSILYPEGSFWTSYNRPLNTPNWVWN